MWTAPEHALSDMERVDELCANAGLILDPWQRFVLEHSLGVRPDERWAAFEVGVCTPRQNGKNAILEAVELAGLFILGDELIIHSAHQWDTSLEAFGRLTALIEGTPDLLRRVKRRNGRTVGISGTHGQEGITLQDNRRIRFRTRSKSGGGGRGFTCDRLIFDEAMHLAEATHAAILPTLQAVENPQVWYTGSAVDQEDMPDGVVFARLRDNGHRRAPEVAWFEWSAEAENPEMVTPEMAADPEVWAASNPAYGVRVTGEKCGYMHRSLSPRKFAVEILNVGDWPRTDGLGDARITPDMWAGRTDPHSSALDPVCIAFDVKPDRSRVSIAAGGFRPDGDLHVEIIDRLHGTAGAVDRLAALWAAHQPFELLCDATGPAGSLIPELEARGLIVRTVTSTEHGQACGALFDAVDQGRIWHLGTSELAEAIRGAGERPLGDQAFAWSRKNSNADISPLVAVTLAAWAATGTPAPLDVDDYFVI